MGLISKEVEIVLNGNIKWYENKGYDIPKRIDKKGRLRTIKGVKILVSVSDLQPHSNVVVKCKCDNCDKEYATIWDRYNTYVKEDGKIYCRKCARQLYGGELARISQVKNGTSLNQWCADNNRFDIIERWDFNLNNYTPNDVGYKSQKFVWIKCASGIHNSELKQICLLTTSKGSISCKACNSIGQFLIDKYGNNALDIYWSNKNKINPFEITIGSGTKVWLKCKNCGTDKLIRFPDFKNYGFSCPKCSDGISFPNKFAFSLLDQLDVYFQTEYSPDWIKPKKYDFYFELNKKNIF